MLVRRIGVASGWLARSVATAAQQATRKKLVILGTGWAGFKIMKDVDLSTYDITVVSPRNHFLFTPLLASTTVGTLEFRSVIEPVRRAKSGIHYYQAECLSVDTDKKTIACENVTDRTGFQLDYDTLVVSVGARSATFGVPGVPEHAHFLKSLNDARRIRERIVQCFEWAAVPNQSPEERKAHLHFVVVGGGPTGVEFSAELHDFLREDVSRYFPEVKNDVVITLIEGKGILGSFNQRLVEETKKHFKKRNIELLIGVNVKNVGARDIELTDGRKLTYGLCVWATGNKPVPFIDSLGWKKSKSGRLMTDGYLRAKRADDSIIRDVYALGDCAMIEGGETDAATAQHAQQEGRYLARQLMNAAGGKQVTPFRYSHKGMLAYIGGYHALADLKVPVFGAIPWEGLATWVFWRSAYATDLVSWKNKILVPFDWAKAFFFGRDISRF